MPEDVTDFQVEVIERSGRIPVLVDFWAPWCGPCRVLGPVLERLAHKHAGEWELAKVNTDEHQDVASRYGIRGIPSVKLFVNGAVKSEFTGALPEHMIEQWLKKELPGKYDTLISQAESLAEIPGRQADAGAALQEVLTAEPDNEQANLLMGRLLVFENPEASLPHLEKIREGSEFYDRAAAIHTFARLFSRQDNPASLPDNAAKQPYLEAIATLRTRDFDSALERFIALMREARSYDQEGAKQACRAIFTFLGEENEITKKHRRSFGSALYV